LYSEKETIDDLIRLFEIGRFDYIEG